MRQALFAVSLFLAAGCSASRPDVIQVGPWFPKKNAKDVQLLSSRADITRPWGAIAIIHSEKFPAENRSAIERQKKLARELAAQAGADGIIISQETVSMDPQLGVYQSPETYISALAFKYVADISTTTK